MSDRERERLGRLVRATWVEWANEQPIDILAGNVIKHGVQAVGEAAGRRRVEHIGTPVPVI